LLVFGIFGPNSSTHIFRPASVELSINHPMLTFITFDAYILHDI